MHSLGVIQRMNQEAMREQEEVGGKFKVGDKVRTAPVYSFGAKYGTVTNIVCDNIYKVEIEGSKWSFYEYDLALLEEPEVKPDRFTPGELSAAYNEGYNKGFEDGESLREESAGKIERAIASAYEEGTIDGYGEGYQDGYNRHQKMADPEGLTEENKKLKDEVGLLKQAIVSALEDLEGF